MILWSGNFGTWRISILLQVTQNYYKAGDVIPQDERHGGHAIYRVKQAGQWNGEDKPFDKFGKFVNVQFKGPTKDEKIDIVQKAEFVPREEYSDGGDQNRKCSKEDTMAGKQYLKPTCFLPCIRAACVLVRVHLFLSLQIAER